VHAALVWPPSDERRRHPFETPFSRSGFFVSSTKEQQEKCQADRDVMGEKQAGTITILKQ